MACTQELNSSCGGVPQRFAHQVQSLVAYKHASGNVQFAGCVGRCYFSQFRGTAENVLLSGEALPGENFTGK